MSPLMPHKMGHLKQLQFFLANQNATGDIWDQSCHLQDYAAQLFNEQLP